jgi:hypothetical protein
MARGALATQKKLACLCFQCLARLPYSPDLAPLGYHLFPGLKKTIEREVDRAKDLSAPQVFITQSCTTQHDCIIYKYIQQTH